MSSESTNPEAETEPTAMVEIVTSSRTFSPARILMAAITLGLAGWVGYIVYDDLQSAAPGDPLSAWSAPYVDVTVTPYYPFESADPLVSDVVLAFVVADKEKPCRPSWGAAFDLEDAAVDLDLDRRIARFRQTGRDVVVSFGGLINDELATVCTDVEELADAYAEVVERYDIVTIDLDIEGEAMANTEANARRAEAVARIQADRRSAGSELAVWATLPASTSGITAEGEGVVDSLLAGGVDLAGINLMTMNFGPSMTDMDMSEAVEASLAAGARQAMRIWRNHDVALSELSARKLIGATPMIGRNDIVTETFTVDDAEELSELVVDMGYGRASYWSLNRDHPCGANEAPILPPSNHCSHQDQYELAFAEAFDTIEGRASDAAGRRIEALEITLLADDPDTSPYPLWETGVAFETGEKVVWRGYVYQSKWYTVDDDPETQVANEWDSPWRLIGPVLPSDLTRRVLVPEGIVDPWTGDIAYQQGDRVWIDGRVYEARWWTEGYQPNRPAQGDWESPWNEIDARDFMEELDLNS